MIWFVPPHSNVLLKRIFSFQAKVLFGEGGEGGDGESD